MIELTRRRFLATTAVTGATLAAPSIVHAQGKVTVGMAWPGMQDAVWSTSHKLLNEFAATARSRRLRLLQRIRRLRDELAQPLDS